jgi:AraC family transcriptional regulator
MDAWQSPFEVSADSDHDTGVAPRRALTSAAEFAALVGATGRQVVTAVWGDLRFLTVELGGMGSLRVSLPGFFSVARFSGGGLTLPSAATAGALRHDSSGLVLVHGLRHGFDYCWHASHCMHWVCLEPRLLNAASRAFGLADAPPVALRAAAEDHVCANLLGVLAEEAALGPHLAQRLIVDSVANALAARLLQRFGTGIRAVCPPGALAMRAFREVCAFIDGNLGNRLSLGDLAAIAGVSRFHFARQFRLRTGETPMGYVLRRRVERAQQLLGGRGCRISDVAALLGFADQSHFTRTFKRFVGVSPSQYSVIGAAASHGSSVTTAQLVGSLAENA